MKIEEFYKELFHALADDIPDDWEINVSTGEDTLVAITCTKDDYRIQRKVAPELIEDHDNAGQFMSNEMKRAINDI